MVSDFMQTGCPSSRAFAGHDLRPHGAAPAHGHNLQFHSLQARARSSPPAPAPPPETLSFLEVGPQRTQRLGVGVDGEVREVGEPGLGTGQKEAWSGASAGPLGPARSFLAGLFLPQGWPDSVTPDYLEYQLWTLPTHVTGVVSHALATTSMLQVGAPAAGPAPENCALVVSRPP